MPKPLLIAVVTMSAAVAVRFGPALLRRIHALSATTFLVVRAR
ncbi:hypothetical protein [Microbacterium sp. 18062]|nr:hypothetical protein [Microbacterium sp. 18062]